MLTQKPKIPVKQIIFMEELIAEFLYEKLSKELYIFMI